MKMWLRKLAVILITILTLGTYIPPITINSEAEDSKDAENVRDNSFVEASEIKEIEIEDHVIAQDPIEDFLVQLTDKAKEQTITKLGPKIMKQVEDDLFDTILPHMEQVIEKVVLNSDDEEVAYYEITEDASKGLGERIFNVYDNKTNKIVLKFHVRRENRPLEGYWFNFHYHASTDNFEEHHNIGEIYWDKNVPPQWMA